MLDAFRVRTVRQALIARGAVSVEIGGLLAHGVQSEIWDVVADRAPYAVKCFRPGFQDERLIAGEFAALSAFARALDQRSPVRCPRAVECWPWGYLMTAVDGEPLERVLHRDHVEGQLAASLVDAIQIYHGARAEPYGDFHSGNVLVSTAGVASLIDPTAARPDFFRWPGEQPDPLAVDVAYWMFSAESRLPGLMVSDRRFAARQLQFARLIRSAATKAAGPGLAVQIERCTRQYWRLLSTRGIRGRVVTLTGPKLSQLLTTGAN